MSLQLESSPPSSPAAGLANPFAGPFDFLTLLCNVVPGISFDPIRSRATVDVVFAPIHRTDAIVATSPASFVLAAAKAQRVGAAPCVDAVSPTVAVDSFTIRGAYKVVGSVIAFDSTFDRSRREACVGVLGDPADPLELPSGMQPGPFHVQVPHQAVAARVGRMPVQVESPLEGVGGYALPALALSVWVQLRLPGTPEPTRSRLVIG